MKIFGVVILVLVIAAPGAVGQATQPVDASGSPLSLTQSPEYRGEGKGTINRRDGGAGAGANAPMGGPGAVRVALSLAGVLALIVVLAVIAKKVAPRGKFGAGISGGGGAIHVLARTTIAPKQRIVLLQVGRKILVLGDCDGHPLSTLCEIGDFDEAAGLIGQLQADGGSKSFSAALENAMERFRAAERDATEPPRRSSESIDAMRQEIEGLAQRVRGMAR